MSTFVFTSQPAMGHLNSLLTIAQQLKLKGHDIVFICSGPKNIEQNIINKGFSTIRIRDALSSPGFALLPLFSGYTETFIAFKLFFGGLYHYTKTISSILNELKPVAVISDFGFPAGGLAAELNNIPYVIVYSAGLYQKGDGIPPMGSGLPIGEDWGFKGKLYNFMTDLLTKNIDNTVLHIRKKLNLKPIEKGKWAWLSSPWLTLVLTDECIEAPRYPFLPTNFFIGPCFSGRDKEGKSDFPYEKFSPDKPKIYVSLGTVFNKKPQVFNKIIKAFINEPYQLIISAGKSFPFLTSKELPSNVLVFERVPQIEVIHKVDVVISHGGNNTVNETLAAGKPLLVTPVGGEQGDNAARIVYLGAGLRADLKKASCEEIKTKIKKLIEDSNFSKRAKEIALNLKKTDGTATAVKLIEHLVKTQKPLLRTEPS